MSDCPPNLKFQTLAIPNGLAHDGSLRIIVLFSPVLSDLKGGCPDGGTIYQCLINQKSLSLVMVQRDEKTKTLHTNKIGLNKVESNFTHEPGADPAAIWQLL